MRKFLVGLFLAVVLFAGDALARTTDFAWDYDNNASPDAVGFRLYRGTSPSGAIGDKTVVLTIQDPTQREVAFEWETPLVDGNYYFVLTAFDGEGNESGPSNEVLKNIDTFPPASPTNFRLK